MAASASAGNERIGFMERLRVLRFTSCQAENAERIGRDLTRYLGVRLGLATEFVDGIPWQQRERLLDEGRIHVGWICGLPYVQKADGARPTVKLLAAPVMAAARYAGRPVYFSDVVVAHGHTARSFGDLRGARWAYNEPGSHSGYNIVRYQLASRGESAGFFSRVVESGAHQATLRLIAEGKVDASAIDSTVLETEFRNRPRLRECLRVIETWGPSPAPPWVASARLPAGLLSRIRKAMTEMHRDAAGRVILRRARMAGFASVPDCFYDAIRRMSTVGEAVAL